MKTHGITLLSLLLWIGLNNALAQIPPPAFSTDSVTNILLNYAQNTPEHLAADLDSLVNYLKVPCKNQLDLANVLAYWEMTHVDYDIDVFNGKSVVNGKDYHKVLDTRLGVCQDYALLYKAMCDRVGIKCYLVQGFAKGIDFNQVDFKQTNHAWNVIVLNGQYHLLDVTWASGYANYDFTERKWRYVRKTKLEELFVRPETFIATHLPTVPLWQLLEKPINMPLFVKHSNYASMLVDSLSIYKAQDSLRYNVQDSLQNFEKLDSLHKEVKIAEESFKFFPEKMRLIYAYYQAFIATADREEQAAKEHYMQALGQIKENMTSEQKDTIKAKIALSIAAFERCLANLKEFERISRYVDIENYKIWIGSLSASCEAIIARAKQQLLAL